MITNPHSFTNSSNNNTKHPPISTHQHADISTPGCNNSNTSNTNTSNHNLNNHNINNTRTRSSLLLLMISFVLVLATLSFTTLASIDTDPESFRLVSIRKSGIKPTDDLGLIPPQGFSWSRFQGPHFSPGGSGRSASRRRNELYSRQEDPYTRYLQSHQLRSNHKPPQDVNFYMTRYSPTHGPERLRRN